MAGTLVEYRVSRADVRKINGPDGVGRCIVAKHGLQIPDQN